MCLAELAILLYLNLRHSDFFPNNFRVRPNCPHLINDRLELILIICYRNNDFVYRVIGDGLELYKFCPQESILS